MSPQRSAPPPPLRFDFGSGPARPGYTKVTPSTAYTPSRGYGFEDAAGIVAVDRGGTNDLRADFCTSSNNRPFFFSLDLPEGNFDVTLTLGDRTGASVCTVKAEARRLMLDRAQTAPGQFAIPTFTVAVKRPALKGGGTVRLKPDEQTGHRDWDDRLTLEFGGARPCVCAVEIAPASDAITVFLAGDSTVTDQAREPWAAWGQMLPRFFKPGVAVANHAQSGESLRSFLAERRLEKILDTLRAGDYLFVQFAHNDQKPGLNHVEPFSTYQDELRRFVNAARERKAVPVLVTSMHRRRFDEHGKIVNTLGDYPDAVRQLARDENIALIDLNAMSKTLFEALGPEASKKAFVHYPANTFPGQTEPLKDDTHFSNYGAYQLARCVVEGIKTAKLPLARFLSSDALPPFNPARPDSPDRWSL